MKTISVGELHEVTRRMDDRLPVQILRYSHHDSRYETPNEPEAIHCRSTIHALVIEIDDQSVADLMDTAYENEDAAGEVEDMKMEVKSIQNELDRAEQRIVELESELARLKPATA